MPGTPAGACAARAPLRRARRFYRRGRFSAAARAAERLLAGARPGLSRDLRDAAVLLALFAYAKAGEFRRGLELAQRHAAAGATHLDFCYAACYLAYRSGDLGATERWGRIYLERHAQQTAAAPHAETRAKIHEVLNTLGCAAKDRGDDEEALALLDAAIAAQPDYALPYLNAALVAERAGRADQRARYLREGIARCGEVEELRMLERAAPRPARISLCMIVRDEEEMLPGALDSVRGVADEIVVVDTGSTDATVEVARSRGARVYHHAWENDFSKARNLSIGYATGDWVLILDADERLDPASAPLVRKLAASCAQEAVSFSVYNIDTDNDHISFLPSVRMFRTGRGYGYVGIVHNQINIPPDTPVMRAPVRIDHYGYTPSLATRRGKFERTTALLQQQLEANPDDAFAHFNMAQILRGGTEAKGHAPRILQHAARVTELLAPEDSAHRHILLMAWHQLASSQFVLGRYEEAEASCRRALTLKGGFIDCLMTLGHTLSMRRRYDEARETYLKYLRVLRSYREADETSGFILLHLKSEYQAHYGLGLIEEALGRHALALEWYRKVAQARADYLETHLRIGRLCIAMERWAEGEAAFRRELEFRPDSFWAHYCLGDLAVRAERWSEARTHYGAARRARPEHPHLALNLATCHHQLGAHQEAEAWLARVPEAIAAQPPALKLGADIAFERAEYERARVGYESYLAHQSGDAAAWLGLGNAHFRTGALNAAEICYRRALAENPELAVGHRNLAMIWVRRERFDLARGELQTYLDRSGDGEARLLLADMLASAGAHAEALPHFEQYLAAHPRDEAALFRLASSYLAMGQADAAILGYRHILAANPGHRPARQALAALGRA